MWIVIGKQHDWSPGLRSLLPQVLFWNQSWTAGVFVGVVFHVQIEMLCYVLPSDRVLGVHSCSFFRSF